MQKFAPRGTIVFYSSDTWGPARLCSLFSCFTSITAEHYDIFISIMCIYASERDFFLKLTKISFAMANESFARVNALYLSYANSHFIMAEPTPFTSG